jgi:hypothetical protein
MGKEGGEYNCRVEDRLIKTLGFLLEADLANDSEKPFEISFSWEL